MFSFSYSEPVSVQSMFEGWNPPFHGGEIGLTYDHAEVGLRWRDWRFGLLWRYDYLLEFSADTAEIFYRTENRLPLQAGRTYELRIEALNTASRGLRLGRAWRITPELRFAAGISWLRGYRLTDGWLRGRARAVSEKDFDFSFETDYSYSRDVIFGREVDGADGWGYSIDAGLEWQATDRLALSAKVIDLAGRIDWREAPYTTAMASSETKTYDADGYVRYKPLARGFEGYRSFSQTLPRKIFLSSAFRLDGSTELLAEYRDFSVRGFAEFGLGRCWGTFGCGRLLLNPADRALRLGYRGHGIRLELASDNIDFSRARLLSLVLSIGS